MKNIISLAAITIASTMLSYGTSQADMTDEVLGLEATTTSTSRVVCWAEDYKSGLCVCRKATGETFTAGHYTPKGDKESEKEFKNRVDRFCKGVQEYIEDKGIIR